MASSSSNSGKGKKPTDEYKNYKVLENFHFILIENYGDGGSPWERELKSYVSHALACEFGGCSKDYPAEEHISWNSGIFVVGVPTHACDAETALKTLQVWAEDEGVTMTARMYEKRPAAFKPKK